MLVCGTSVVPGLVCGYTPVGLSRVDDGAHMRLCREEDGFYEPSLGPDGSATLLQLPTDVLLIVFRKTGGAGVLPFVCRRFRDVVAKGLSTGVLETSRQATQAASLFLLADDELWSRREFLGEDGLTRALLSAPWHLGPHVVEQACALLRRLPLQAQLVALTPCFAWVDKRIHAVGREAFARMDAEQVRRNLPLLARCVADWPEELELNLGDAGASSFYFSLRCWDADRAERFLLKQTEACRARIGASEALMSVLKAQRDLMVYSGKQPADFAQRRATAVAAVNEMLARVSNVHLPGSFHTDALVHCSSVKLVDEKRAPLDCVFVDALGSSVAVRLHCDTDRLLLQDVGVDVMAQMTHDWQTQGLAVHCTLLQSQLCERLKDGWFVALVRGRPEKESLSSRSRVVFKQSGKHFASEKDWLPALLASETDKARYVSSIAGAAVFQAMLEVDDLHNDNLGVSDCGEFAIHEVFYFFGLRRRSKFGIVRQRDRHVFLRAGLLRAANVDMDEFANLCVSAQRAVSCASMLPFLLGRLCDYQDEVLKWARSPRLCDKVFVSLLKEPTVQLNDVMH
jgi:hypothetical protein